MSLMISVHPDILLPILEDVGHIRPLSETESELVQAIVGLSLVPFAWSPSTDRELLRSSVHRGGTKAFANRHKITAAAAYTRISRLRRKGRANG